MGAIVMTTLSRPHARAARTACAAIALATLATDAYADPHTGSGPLADTHAPAGVMFDHMHKAGEWMVELPLREQLRGQPDLLHGIHTVTDDVIAEKGCSPHTCSMKTTDMTMNMYMLDIMYAPTDWVTLMVMPMWMSHDMTMSPLRLTQHGGNDEHGEGHAGGHSGGHGRWPYRTAFARRRRLRRHDLRPRTSPRAWAELSYPVQPDVERADRQGRLQERMACSPITACSLAPAPGTSGRASPIPAAPTASPGARRSSASCAWRRRTQSGYQLGDVFQATGWVQLSASPTGSRPRSAASIPSRARSRATITARHNHSSPPDLQFNYGGRFWDIGFGVNTVVPSGALRRACGSARNGCSLSTTIRTATSRVATAPSGPMPAWPSEP